MTALEPRRTDSCLSDLVFDEWFADELAPEARSAAEAHLRDCARCQMRKAEITEERAGFYDALPNFQALSRKVEGARPKRASRRTVLGFATGALLAAAAVLLMVRTPDEGGTRLKGSPHLGLLVKHDNIVRRGANEERVSPGDTVRFSYSSSEPRHLAIVSLDEKGIASRYFPAEATRAMRAGTNVHLDFGVELDATLGRETVYGLFCEQSFDVEDLRRTLEQTRKLTAPAGCTLDTLVLVKEATP